jgi:TPP-dependent pyruvate/acetoin dehydrogenase alpha subunit
LVAFPDNRDPTELENARSRDPIAMLVRHLAGHGALSSDEYEEIESRARLAVEAAIDFAERSPFPDLSEATSEVFA